jgi:hypothetical protein
MSILPGKEERGIVVFWLLPSLTYGTRLGAGLTLAAAGIVMQVVSGAILPGAVLLAAANLLLLIRGYDNRVDLRGFDPAVEWERVELDQLGELAALDRRIRRWDRSALDVSNGVGLVVFVVVVGVLGWLTVAFPGDPRTLAIDGLVLLVPHWLTGIRRILVKPKLLVRVEAIRAVLDGARHRLARHRVQLLMLLRGGEVRIPDDVKFRVDPPDKHEDFLGLYGQVVINDVQGTSYPYFYVVLVARAGFGLQEICESYDPPGEILKEFKVQDQVEVMVIRQRATKTSGYHTKPEVAAHIFREVLDVAERIAEGVSV